MKKLDISKLTVPTGIFNTSGKAGVLFKDYLKSALKYLNVGYTDSCCNETFVAEGQTSGGGLESVTGFGVDNTDPLNPIVNKYQVDSVTSAGTNFATATQIYSPISSIVSGANNSGVKLPSSPNENEIYVIFSQSTTFGFIVYSTDSFLNQMIVNNQSVSSFTISPNDFSTYTFRYMGGAWSVNQEQVAQNNIKDIKVNISSTEILQLNTTPKTIVPAQGSGTLIVPIKFVIRYNYGTVSYSNNNNFKCKLGNWDNLVSITNLTLGTNSQLVLPSVANTNTVDTTATAEINQPLVAYVPTGDPINGDGTIDVYLTYNVITI